MNQQSARPRSTARFLARVVATLGAGTASGCLAVACGTAAAARVAALATAQSSALSPVQLDRLVSTAALAGLALCLTWAALVLVLSALARLPGAVGLLMRRVALLLTPRAARTALAMLCGLGPAVAVIAPASANTHPVARQASQQLTGDGADVAGSHGAGPHIAAPQLAGPAVTLDRPDVAPAELQPDDVLVRPGDNLWSLAGEWLRAHHRRADAPAIATEWPRWYAANRSTVGSDPDLLRPGQALSPPEQ